MPRAQTWGDVEQCIKQAVADGILLDKRGDMPRGVYQGKQVEWSTISIEDVLGCCLHQNGSQNDDNPMGTARYHTGNSNHIGSGKPLASTCYAIMIPNLPGPAWLTGDLSWKMWAQGGGGTPGDENRHLKAILVMGGFEGPGYKRSYTKKGPTAEQVEKLVRVVKWMMEVFGFGGEGVFGHFHFGKASCPGTALMQWVEDCRDKDDKAAFADVMEWQRALLRWNPGCLPKHGPDGDWGGESKRALISFQRAQNISRTGQRDPFTQLILLQRFPAPKVREVVEAAGLPYPAATLDVAPDASAVFTSAEPTGRLEFDTSDAPTPAPEAPASEPATEPPKPARPAREPAAKPQRAKKRTTRKKK